MPQKDKFSTTAIEHAFQYTLLISILYAIIKFFDINSPHGTEFISYILPILFADIILIVFPFLFVFFYFKDGKAISDVKEHIFNGINYQSKEIDAPEVLREYHNMLKEGVLTQDEFDRIKKKYLRELNKD
jgi:hypothetical protein